MVQNHPCPPKVYYGNREGLTQRRQMLLLRFYPGMLGWRAMKHLNAFVRVDWELYDIELCDDEEVARFMVEHTLEKETQL